MDNSVWVRAVRGGGRTREIARVEVRPLARKAEGLEGRVDPRVRRFRLTV